MVGRRDLHHGVNDCELSSHAITSSEQETTGDRTEHQAHGEVGDEGALISEPDFGFHLDRGLFLLLLVSWCVSY